MKIPALIMAGGKGKRMGLPTEKPLLPFLGKPMIDWVAQAVSCSNNVSDWYIVTSPNTSETEKHCREKGWKIVRTDAKGYHDDLKQAAYKTNLRKAILTIPADLPTITSKFLDKVINEFGKSRKDFFAVFVPIQTRQGLGLSIDSTDEYNGEWYAVSGVNIVNGQKIQNEGKIETSALITSDFEVTLNINTIRDLEIAEKLMQSKAFSQDFSC